MKRWHRSLLSASVCRSVPQTPSRKIASMSRLLSDEAFEIFLSFVASTG
jgi:hypothetical protein